MLIAKATKSAVLSNLADDLLVTMAENNCQDSSMRLFLHYRVFSQSILQRALDAAVLNMQYQYAVILLPLIERPSIKIDDMHIALGHNATDFLNACVGSGSTISIEQWIELAQQVHRELHAKAPINQEEVENANVLLRICFRASGLSVLHELNETVLSGKSTEGVVYSPHLIGAHYAADAIRVRGRDNSAFGFKFSDCCSEIRLTIFYSKHQAIRSRWSRLGYRVIREEKKPLTLCASR